MYFAACGKEALWRQAEKNLNIAEACLARHARADHPNKVAMIFVADDMTSESYTYAQLNSLSARFARWLEDQGLRQGDRVLIQLPNSCAFPVTFFAALRTGIIPVPISPMLTETEMDFLRQDSGAKLLVSEANFPSRTDLENLIPLSETYAAAPDEPAYMVYTSGTAGYPKGVLHAHRALTGRLPAAEYWFDFSVGDRILHSGKFNWTYVLGTGMMDPLYHEKTVVVYEGNSSAERWVEIMKQFGCNTFIGVPTIFRQILQKTNASGGELPALKHAMSAGEHLTESVLQQWTERFGFPIYEGLGMSECSYYISQRRGDRIMPGSAGKIQPGHLVKILDENLVQVPANSEGMLCIERSDPGLFLGYWNSPEANAAAFSGNWFLTGDYARTDAEGYIYFMGRRDEIIKSFGYRVSPLEIERVFRDHPAIEDVVAFAEVLSPEKTLIALCVQVKAGQAFDGEQILIWGKERLAAYKLPKQIYRLEKLPRSANGKVLRRQIAKTVRINSGA